jgi:hypothetical protein
MSHEIAFLSHDAYTDPAHLLVALEKHDEASPQDILNAASEHASTTIVDIIHSSKNQKAKAITIANFLENQEYNLRRSKGELPVKNRGERVYGIADELSQTIPGNDMEQDFELYVASLTVFGKIACHHLGIEDY